MLPVYEVAPDETARGGVIVVQEAFGVNEHIRDVTRRFSREGYHAVAPHLFHRTGDPELGYESIDAVRPHMAALTSEGLAEDLTATLGLLGEQGIAPSATAVVGFCMGGTVALVAGARWSLGAAVTFYGGGVREGRFGEPPLVDLAPRLQTPWLGLYGDEDRGIPVEQVEELREAAARSAVDTDVVRYPDAGHGFHCDVRDAYHPTSARDAWGRTLAWLDAHLARP